MARAAKRLFICLGNAGYEVSPKRQKIYFALPDAKADRRGFLDKSGEDYLCPSQRFVAADLPVSIPRDLASRLTIDLLPKAGRREDSQGTANRGFS
jgi:hypothetical protein